MLLENSKKIKNMLTIRSILIKVKFPKASRVYPKALIVIRLNYGTMLVHSKKILKIIIIIIIVIDKMSILTILNSQSNQIYDIPTHKLNTSLLVY